MTFDHRAGTDGTIRLRDGRTLSYREWNPDGIPVFVFHGTGLSRVVHYGNDLPWKVGVRLIMPDRPGFGLTDHHPGRTQLDWASDVAELADAIGIDRFAVLGVSGGGPGAAACGFALPERVTAVGLVSAVGPYRDDPGMASVVPKGWRQDLMEMAAQDPAAAESSIRRQCEADLEAMARDIEASLDEWTEDTPESDRALMRDPENRAMLRENNRQAVLRGADGLVQELLLNYTAPWGFRLEDIAAPVFIWHGDRDPQVPVEVAHRMAERIPQCTLTIYPGEGHMIDVAHADDILRTLGPVA